MDSDASEVVNISGAAPRPPVGCRNCRHPVHLHFCPSCGQHIADHNTKLWKIVQEFSDEFIRLDSKFLRTVVPLVFRPGFLTKQWVDGKRVRYITPLKIYVTISAIAFLILSYHISQQKTSLAGLGINVHRDDVADAKELATKPSDNWLVSGAKQVALNTALTDSRTLTDRYVSQLPSACLALVPVAAMVFGCLYIRRKRFYVEHLVFMLHFNSFCFLMISVCTLVPGFPGWLAYLWVNVYLFIAIRVNYQQGWIKTFFKFGLFGFAYLILIALTMGMTAIAAAIMVGKPADKVPAVPAPAAAPNTPKSVPSAQNTPKGLGASPGAKGPSSGSDSTNP